MELLKGFFLAARPKTLTASLVPIIASVALVQSLQLSVDWTIVILALFSSFCIQIGTNFVNDAMDFKKGADTEQRIGPARVTQKGIFTFRQVMTMAAVFFGCAVLCGIPLVLKGGSPILVIGIVSVLMGYGYTSGPYPLAYKGLGDLFVILFFGLVAVGGLFYLLSGTYIKEAFILGLQIGFLSTILIAINNLRDIETDAIVGKNTLAVRLGLMGGRIWIAFLVLAPILVGYYWLFQGKIWLYILPALSLPLGIFILKGIFKNPPSPEYNKYLGMSAAYGLLFSILFFLGSHL